MRIFITCFLFVFLSSCNRQSSLSRYYLNNAGVHLDISNSVAEFSKKHKCKVSIRKSVYEKEIFFRFWIGDNPEGFVVVYDSLNRRHDPYESKTKNIIIPQSVITNFQKLVYPSMEADSNRVFFGHKYTGYTERHRGVLVNLDTSNKIEGFIEKISDNVFIYESVIP